jgi:hypothetical protein
LPIWDASAAKFRHADFDRQNVVLLTPAAGLIYELAGLIRGISTVCGFIETSGVAFSKLSKLLNQENALSVPCLKRFHNYCGPIKLATCGSSWEKTAYFETIAASNICLKLVSHLGKSYFIGLISQINVFGFQRGLELLTIKLREGVISAGCQAQLAEYFVSGLGNKALER